MSKIEVLDLPQIYVTELIKSALFKFEQAQQLTWQIFIDTSMP